MSADRVTSAAGMSRNLMAIVVLFSAVFGGVGGFLAAFLFLSNELEIWRQIKAAHDAPVPNSDAIVYNHSRLGEEDISSIKERLALPNFENFALKDELWTNQELEATLIEIGFIKVGQHILIKDASEPSIALTRHASDYANTYDETRTNLTAKWSRVWFIERDK